MQRSVTEMRRSRSGLANLSVSAPSGVCATPEISGIALTSARGMMRRDISKEVRAGLVF
ncbi:hypothetical protein BVIET440_230061 [Burkholderia vietnamiensis]